jgi:hypothetical protein
MVSRLYITANGIQYELRYADEAASIHTLIEISKEKQY